MPGTVGWKRAYRYRFHPTEEQAAELSRTFGRVRLVHNGALIAVDRRYPSSKTCSHRGHLLATLPPSAREWTCPGCGEAHDRDVNAALL